jgi:hypothetical protein
MHLLVCVAGSIPATLYIGEPLDGRPEPWFFIFSTNST